MATRFRMVILVALGVLLPAIVLQPAAADSHRSHSPEGAWYGTSVVTSPPGIPPIAVTDIYTASATRPTTEGTVLCTIAAEGKIPIVVGGEVAYWVRQQPTGSGTWVRVGRNRVAVTVWRLLVNADTGASAGWIKNWGVGTMSSENRLTVALKSQFYDLNGVPIFALIESTVTEERVRVDLGQSANQP